jgi:hypothetical protein
VVPESSDVRLTRENVSDVIGNLISPISSPFLMQNHPNPLDPTTQINYSVPQTSYVRLKVYDLLGFVEAKKLVLLK